MTDHPLPEDPADPAADTAQFQAFVARDDSVPPPAVGAPFRVVTLIVGLLVLGALVWLLFLL